MNTSYTYKPVTFFSSTLIVTWVTGFLSAYLSHHNNLPTVQACLMAIGLFSPFVTAIIMIYSSKNKAFINDFWARLSIYKIKLTYLPIVLLLMPIVLLLATSISLLFGQSTDQCMLSEHVKTGLGLLSVAILFIVSAIEELGWRGYGVDSLASRSSLFKTSIIFAIMWALWHLPLFFIKGSYQNQLLDTNSVYVINFFVSLLPAATLLNWIYYKNNRSIIAAILLHFMLNIFSMLFQTTQCTKCIVTILLLILAGIIICVDKELFFNMHKDEKKV